MAVWNVICPLRRTVQDRVTLSLQLGEDRSMATVLALPRSILTACPPIRVAIYGGSENERDTQSS